MNQQSSDEALHWYNLSFYWPLMKKTISTYIGWPDKNVTQERIQKASAEFGLKATANLTLVSVSYLGNMTEAEFNAQGPAMKLAKEELEEGEKRQAIESKAFGFMTWGFWLTAIAFFVYAIAHMPW